MRSRGGLSTKVHLLADEPGLPVAFRITAGQAAEYAQAISLLQGQRAEAVIADKGYDSTEIVTTIEAQIKEAGLSHAEKYLPFLGTLFLFIAMSSLGTMIPGFAPPTGSLSTTAALAACVFLAVPFFGIKEQGVRGYLQTYSEPTILMLPFNIISELSRTLALAVRLFGNMMSGVMIIGILLTITPLLFPLVMLALGLLTGMVQAYIFSILAAVYIAAATRTRTREISHG